MQNQIPKQTFNTPYRTINSFVQQQNNNADEQTIASFGNEWQHFNQFSDKEIKQIGSEYFDIVTEKMVNKNTVMGDFGCGSGRFAKYWQPIVQKLVAIDPSKAIFVADNLLGDAANVELCQSSIDNIPYPDNYFDFVMSIGVLHHIPNTQKAMSDCVKKIKPNGYFYAYIYYNFDNKSRYYRTLWQLSNYIRLIVSGLPNTLKRIVCNLLALVLYMPFVWVCRMAKKMNISDKLRHKIPLSYYENKSFYIIRNDALDRFGTPLEQRFSQKSIEQMMLNCGLTNMCFSTKTPYWHVVAQKK